MSAIVLVDTAKRNQSYVSSIFDLRSSLGTHVHVMRMNTASASDLPPFHAPLTCSLAERTFNLLTDDHQSSHLRGFIVFGMGYSYGSTVCLCAPLTRNGQSTRSWKFCLSCSLVMHSLISNSQATDFWATVIHLFSLVVQRPTVESDGVR